jgi:GMP synthase (glutamine-hydrolysing)
MGTTSVAVLRNEVDSDYAYHCDALAGWFDRPEEVDFPAGERPAPDLAVDGVVLTGSTAGVYEADERPWIRDEERLVRELVDRGIPTLGVCFGHQVANSALGGTVVPAETTSRLVAADLATDPLFEGVEPVVTAAHGDVVTDPGEGMEVVASADYYDAFATRHRSAPLWTVQFHPELTAAHRDRLAADFGWTETDLSFEQVNAPRVFENFRTLVEESATRA